MVNELKTDNLLKNAAYYNVTWHVGVVKGARVNSVASSIAVCAYSIGAAFLAVYDLNAPLNGEAAKILIVNDVYVGEECERAHCCFNLKCLKNRAAIAAFAEYGIKSKKKLQRIHAILEEIVADLEPKIEKHGDIVYYEKPIGTLHRIRKPQKRQNVGV